MHTIYWASWELDEIADRRFRRIIAAVAIPLLIAAVLITIFQLQGLKKGGGTFHAGRYVELLPPQPPAPPAAKQEAPKPLPKPQTKPPVEAKVKPVPKVETKPVPKPVAKPKPVPHKVQPPTPPKPQETARQKAEKALAASGLGALADLRDSNLPTVNGSQPLVSGAITSKGGVGGGVQSFQHAATQSSNAPAGYGSAAITQSQSGEGIGRRHTASVAAPHGFGPDHKHPGENGDKNQSGRTLEEIQLVFDRHKAAFYALYSRARREHPSLQGKIVVSLTISSSGQVTEVHIVTSQLHDPQMEQQVLQMVRSMNFGAKNVPTFTYPNYPIYFQPS